MTAVMLPGMSATLLDIICVCVCAYTPIYTIFFQMSYLYVSIYKC